MNFAIGLTDCPIARRAVDDERVSGTDDPGSGRVEWLDRGEPEVLEGTGRVGRRWPAGVLLALVAVAAAAVIAGLHHGSAPPAARTPPPQTGPVTAPSSPAGRPGRAGGALPPVVVSEVGHPLRWGAADWELFGRGAGVVVRIEPALGRVTRTVVPGLLSSGPVSFLATADGVLVRPLDRVPGYAIPDGRPARSLGGLLIGGGPLYPGPRPGQVWVPVDGGSPLRMVLAEVDGRPTGTRVDIPVNNAGPVRPDGAGYLLVTGTGGVYDARPSGLRRITTGALLAVGPTRWLTVDCDDRDRCVLVVTDRVSGARHVLAPSTSDPNVLSGVISPDGKTAAVLRNAPAGPSLDLINLLTGAERPLPVHADQDGFNDGTLVWSPDSRTLFTVDAGGALLTVDAQTHRVRTVALQLPPLTQLAARRVPR